MNYLSCLLRRYHIRILLTFFADRWFAGFPCETRPQGCLKHHFLRLRHRTKPAANPQKIWQNSNAALPVFYLFFIIYQKTIVWIVTIFWIIEDASVMNFYLPPVSTKSASQYRSTYISHSGFDNHFYNIPPPTSVYQTKICLLYVKSLRKLKKLFNWQSKQILL